MNDLTNDLAAVQEISVIPSILDVICSTTGMRYAAVARVTSDRWLACAVLDRIDFGLKAGEELPVSTTICNEVRTLRKEVFIDHVAEDSGFVSHHTPATYGFQSYVSVPIILPGGEIFGTLCAVDPEPRKLKGSPAEGLFRLFAELIAFHLDTNRKLRVSQVDLESSEGNLATSEASLATSKADLQSAYDEGTLREQFVAVLGHDLRNPLASLAAGVKMLEKSESDPRKVRILRLMTEGAARMSGLIDNLLDFARGRLGTGIGLEKTSGTRIEPMLARIANEITNTFPERKLEIDFDLPRPIDVDPARIGQLFSNLLGNAITHGDPDHAISVRAKIVDGAFQLSVCNGGAPIPEAVMKQLFHPFYRGAVRPSQQGLGLGLYIASEIAKAHDGTLTAASGLEETCFTFRMPIS